MLAGYLLIMAALGVGLHLLARSETNGPHGVSRAAERPEATRPATGSRRGWLVLARHVTGTAMLIAIALPLWGAASWLTERRRQRDSDDSGERDARSP